MLWCRTACLRWEFDREQNRIVLPATIVLVFKLWPQNNHSDNADGDNDNDIDDADDDYVADDHCGFCNRSYFIFAPLAAAMVAATTTNTTAAM